MGDASNSQQVFQGFKTSGDALYIAKKMHGRYAFQFGADDIRERRIEDGVMVPVLSGAETKRYETPATKNYILVPYQIDENHPRHLSESELEHDYPECWTYLQERKEEFEARERGRMRGNPH